jgi:hypothetical protein
MVSVARMIVFELNRHYKGFRAGWVAALLEGDSGWPMELEICDSSADGHSPAALVTHKLGPWSYYP